MLTAIFDDPKVIKSVKTGYKLLKDKKMIQDTRVTLSNLLTEASIDFTEMGDRFVVHKKDADTMQKVQTIFRQLSNNVNGLNLLYTVVTTRKTIIIKEKRR